MEFANEFNLLQLIIVRLERIPVDSRLAHRASGIRGSLLAISEDIEKQRTVSISEIDQIINRGFIILEQAAAERVQKGRSPMD